MKPNKRQKLCHNCDAEIDLDVIVCPFCAADLRSEKPEQKSAPPTVRNLRGETEGSLYPPPYPIKGAVEETIAKPLAEAESPEEKPKSVILPTILLTLGVQLLVLGLLMVLFSHKGVILLKWNAHIWFLYCIGAIPFLYFGYKNLSD